MSLALLACPSSEPTGSSTGIASATAMAVPVRNAPPLATVSAAPAPSASVSAPASASASSSASAASSALPTAEEWKGAAEIRVKGSTALGCETKRVREWVRVLCDKPNDTQGTPAEAKVEKAEVIHGPKDITQIRKEVQLASAAGSTSLITRYVEGTDVEAAFEWTDKEKHLSIFWPAGKPEPLYVGGFK
jgi:hypothetical protein